MQLFYRIYAKNTVHIWDESRGNTATIEAIYDDFSKKGATPQTPFQKVKK